MAKAFLEFLEKEGERKVSQVKSNQIGYALNTVLEKFRGHVFLRLKLTLHLKFNFNRNMAGSSSIIFQVDDGIVQIFVHRAQSSVQSQVFKI